MNLFETLKEFKKIEPDRAFTETSKRSILAHAAPAPVWSVKRAVLRLFETGLAVALTGFFVLLVTGAFSGSKLSPVQYSAIDPATLRAEAQAIDMQIQLANVTYQGSVAESTPQPVKPMAAAQALSVAAATSSVPAPVATGTAATSTTSTISIDQALQQLAN